MALPAAQGGSDTVLEKSFMLADRAVQAVSLLDRVKGAELREKLGQAREAYASRDEERAKTLLQELFREAAAVLRGNRIEGLPSGPGSIEAARQALLTLELTMKNLGIYDEYKGRLNHIESVLNASEGDAEKLEYVWDSIRQLEEVCLNSTALSFAKDLALQVEAAVKEADSRTYGIFKDGVEEFKHHILVVAENGGPVGVIEVAKYVNSLVGQNVLTLGVVRKSGPPSGYAIIPEISVYLVNGSLILPGSREALYAGPYYLVLEMPTLEPVPVKFGVGDEVPELNGTVVSLVFKGYPLVKAIYKPGK